MVCNCMYIYVIICNVSNCSCCELALPAVVDADTEEHWFDASGHVLQPSRWISPDTPEEDDTYGRCIGLCCRPWQRCQKVEDMVHTMFGGSTGSSDCTQGWAA